MISVVMSAAAVLELIQPWDGRLSVAAVNGPAAVVVSGEAAALAEFEVELSARHVMRWRIPETDFVAHSSRVEELADSLVADLAFVRPRQGRARLFSTAECRWMDGAELDAAYWYANVRKTVRFSEAVRELAGAGHRVFVEVSPHPILEAAIADTIEESAAFTPVISGTMHRESHGAAQIILALSRLHVRGVPVDWAKVLGGGRRVALPTYAFQRQRYWPDGAVPLIGASVPGRRREQDRSQAGSWLYRVSWEPVADPPAVALAGTWLVLAPAEVGAGLADDCVRAMSARGARVVVARADTGETGRAELAGLVSRALAGAVGGAGRVGEGAAQPVAGVVSLLALDESALAGHPSVPEGMAATLALVQALGDVGIDAPLWMLTSGAIAAVPGEALPSPAQGSTWGLGRAAGL
jgi:acyl transferase domain-containing protein